MPDTCSHKWEPIAMLMGRYECKICGATAYKNPYSGKMKVHKQILERKKPVNVRGGHIGFIPLEWDSQDKDPDK